MIYSVHSYAAVVRWWKCGNQPIHVGQDVRVIRCHRGSEHAPSGDVGCDAPMVAWFHCRVLVWLHQIMVFNLYDVVLCIFILLMKKGTDERLKGITVEVVTVWDKIFQRGGDVDVRFVAWLL